MTTDKRPWLERVLNPGVLWWVAIPCNALAGVALVLLLLDPAGNFAVALWLLVPAWVVLFGAALVRWLRR
jgi:hypothetical protein